VARLGRYEIVRQLAKGALTDLLIGRSDGMEGFQRYVAIKRLHAQFAKDPKCVEAFVNEARLAARLHHHNIVQVHDIGQDGGQPYFAMEYVHGVDLRTLLARLAKRNEQLPLQHVVQIIASAAAALHHAHEQRGADGKPLGIVHRDVTPANIIVGYDGNVKVVDFGIATAAIRRIKTDQGVLRGSVPYMAPEQCAGQAVDRRSDIFALGIVLYELATVRRLFKGSTEFLTMSAIIAATVPKPSQYRQDIPPELEAIMMKALAREPSQRYQTAGDMALALDKVATVVGVGASTTALANYMRLQFGEQKEPWLMSGNVEEDNEPTVVDFDGGASGLAPPPSEAVQKTAIPRAVAATKSSPIVVARVQALTPIPVHAPAVESARLRKPTLPPPRPPRVDPGAMVPELRRAKTDVDPEPPTDLMVRTSLSHPPPPIPASTSESPAVVVERPRRDPTQIVSPLPTTYPVVEREHKSSTLRWVVVIVALFVGGGAAAFLWWPQTDLAAPTAAPVVEEDDDKAKEPEPEVQRSAMDMTMRDYESAKTSPDAAAAKGEDVKPEEPVAKPAPQTVATTTAEKLPPKKPVAQKITAKATPAPKRAPAKPAPAKRASPAPAAKKPAAKKKWNPDDLFLDEK